MLSAFPFWSSFQVSPTFFSLFRNFRYGGHREAVCELANFLQNAKKQVLPAPRPKEKTEMQNCISVTLVGVTGIELATS